MSFRGGPPIIDSRTCKGLGAFGGGPPVPCLRRPEPFGKRAVVGRLVDEDEGEFASDSDDVLAGNPGRGGKGPGPEAK